MSMSKDIRMVCPLSAESIKNTWGYLMLGSWNQVLISSLYLYLANLLSGAQQFHGGADN